MKVNRSVGVTAVLAAIQKSKELGVQMNIAVVDSGSNLVAFERSVV